MQVWTRSKNMRETFRKTGFNFLLCIGLLSLCGCAENSGFLNPFYEPPTEAALKGERNDNAIAGEVDKTMKARMAAEQIGKYQQAHSPQPYNPVMQPAVVRLMWIPDHLNRHGDLVPAHYYYLKVLSERWAVQDAFELEGQLNGPGGASGGSSNVPFVYDNEVKGR